ASLARHLMTAFDRWNERGFEAIARDYLERLPRRKAGERRTIDLNGDLLVAPPAGRGPPDRTSLVDALARADWYDPQARGPKPGRGGYDEISADHQARSVGYVCFRAG